MMNSTWLNELVADNQTWLVSTLIVATLISFLALIVARFLNRRPAWSHAILLTGLTCVLLAPALCQYLPRTINLTSLLENSPIARQAESPAVLPSDTKQQITSSNPAGKISKPSKPLASPLNSPSKAETKLQSDSSQRAARPATLAKGEGTSIPLSIVLFWIWAGVAGVLIVRLLFQLISLVRSFVGTESVGNLQLQSAFQMAKANIPKTQDIELAFGAVKGPVAMNVPRRQVVIPTSFSKISNVDSLRRIFTHELAHVCRRDQYVLFLQRFLACLFWPFIPIHFLNRAICRTREDLCDNYIAPDESLEFCKDLLEMMKLPDCPDARPSVALVPGLLTKRNLEHRVSGLLATNRCFDPRIRLGRIAIASLTLISCTAAVASIGFNDPAQNKHRYISDRNVASLENRDSRFTPVFRSIALSSSQPANVSVEFPVIDEHAQFTQIRYGNSGSDRATVMVVSKPNSDSFELYLDSNRDRTIEKSERIPVDPKSDPNSRVCNLECWLQVSDECDRAKRISRVVAFRRNLLRDRISFATVGYLEGPVNLGQRTVTMRRVDGNGNGLFNDAEDRIWIDLDEDERFGLTEQLSLRPIMWIGQRRYQVIATPEDSSFDFQPVTDTGSVRLSLPLEDPTATIRQLKATFMGSDGSAFSVDGLKPINVPTGKYEISNVTLVVGAGQNSAAKSFVFSRRGQPVGAARQIEVKKDAELELNPLGILRLASQAYPPQANDNGSIRVRLRLSTADGLTLTHGDSGVRGDSIHSNQTINVATNLIGPNERTIAGCQSGFY